MIGEKRDDAIILATPGAGNGLRCVLALIPIDARMIWAKREMANRVDFPLADQLALQMWLATTQEYGE